MVCFRYIVVTTLHKGDNKDYDDDDNNNNNNKIPHCSKTDEVMSHIADHELWQLNTFQCRCMKRQYEIKQRERERERQNMIVNDITHKTTI